MKRIEFPDIFSGENLVLIKAYRRQLQEVLDRYDVAIFMARKAICFYLSMKINHEVASHGNCRVLSSRVVDYNDLDRFQDQRVAVIDDVVVKGDSLRAVAEKLGQAGITADFYAAACEAGFAEHISGTGINLQGSFAHYLSNDVYRLAGLIAQYIEASMCSFNTDSPVYYLKGDSERLRSLMENRNAAVLTSAAQRKFGIESRALYFRLGSGTAGQYDGSISGSMSVVYNVLRQSIVKIRVYLNDQQVVLVPFILLPACGKDVVEQLYSVIQCPALDTLVRCCNPRIQDENMLKIVEYVYSSAFISVFAGRFHLELDRDSEIDRIQFDQYINEIEDESKNADLQNIFSLAEVQDTGFSIFSFSQYVGAFYGFIGQLRGMEQPYENCSSELLSEKQEDDEFSYLVFSNEDLYDGIPIDVGPEDKKVYASSLVDIFIDMGMIVPSVVHLGSDGLIRAYKMGEYSRLTRDNINAFMKALYHYQEYVQRPLNRTECENLCVLFFRTSIGRKFLCEADSFDEDIYSIVYSLYGPRVSKAKVLYDDRDDVALITEFIGRELIKEDPKGEYNITENADVEDEALDLFCPVFAEDFSILERFFKERPARGEENPWNQWVYTYDQFLTLLSIGENPRNKILSLCAEVDQFLKIRSDIFFDGPSANVVNHDYERSIHGICNGLWEYICFKNDALKYTTGQLKDYDDGRRVIRGVIETDALGNYDRSPTVVKFMDTCGKLLFLAAFVLNEGLKEKGKSAGYALNDPQSSCADYPETIFPPDYLNFEDFAPERERVVDFIHSNVDDPAFDVLLETNFNMLRYDAQLLLDWCDLYLEYDHANCSLVNYFLVVYSKADNLPDRLHCANHISLENVSENNRVMVFSFAGGQEQLGSLAGKITEELNVGTRFPNFELLLFDLRMDKHDGELCFDRVLGDGFILSGSHGKGTSVIRLVRKTLAYIDTLPAESCDRIIRISSCQPDTGFKMDGFACEKTGENAELDGYYVSQFSYRREKPVGTVSVTFQGPASHIVVGDNVSVTDVEYNFDPGFDFDRFTKALEAVRMAGSGLSDEYREAAENCINDIEAQACSQAPDKKIIGRAVDRLKEFGKNNPQFLEAVTTVATIVGAAFTALA